MDESDNTLSPRPSKSQRKREVLALQKLGEALVQLSTAQLATIPLDPTLAEAIKMAQTLKPREGKRRQLQFIGRLMCEVDVVPIQAALDKLKHKDQQNKAHFHQIERWRDKLIAEGDDAIQALVLQFPQIDIDRQQLRQTLRKAQLDKKMAKNTGGETELFRYLRELIHSR